MREIKFRGKRDGKWLYGDLVHIDGDVFIFPVDGQPDYGKNYQVEPETVGQFTGLKDKNGVEIWEGDILGAEQNGNVYCDFVFYNGSSFGRSHFNSFVPFYDRKDWIEKDEVKGNIYDNPELL